MTPLRPFLLTALLALGASAQPQGKAAVEVPVLPAVGAAGAVSAAPLTPNASLTLSPAASLSLSPSAASLAASPAVQNAVAVPAAAVASPAVKPPTARAAASEAKPAVQARSQLSEGARAAVPGADPGRETFDGGRSLGAGGAVRVSAAAEKPTLEKPGERAAAPKTKIPLKQRVGEVAELGLLTLGLNVLGAMAIGAIKLFGGQPWIGGALWGLLGSALVGSLGDMRSIVVGGWQASHDQKYRVDPGTGQLRDIRGHKYGQDRYEKHQRGPVSRTEAAVLESVAFASGLGLQALIWSSDLRSLAVYAAGFAGAFLLRRLWRRLHPVETYTPTAEDSAHASRFRR